MNAVNDALEATRHIRRPEDVRLTRAVLSRLLRATELELKASVEAEAARRLAEEAGATS
jgi:hypothetical protein